MQVAIESGFAPSSGDNMDGFAMDLEQSEFANFVAVYEDLRRLARIYLRTGDSQTLQPTMLVHEAYLKLVDADPGRWQSRQQFIHAAARAMRKILVDHARRKVDKNQRGDITVLEDLSEPENEQRFQSLIKLEGAMTNLEAMDSQLARIVELRFFVGCSPQETAELLELPERTVRLRWGIAKAFLTANVAEAEAGAAGLAVAEK